MDVLIINVPANNTLDMVATEERKIEERNKAVKEQEAEDKKTKSA